MRSAFWLVLGIACLAMSWLPDEEGTAKGTVLVLAAICLSTSAILNEMKDKRDD